MRYLNRLIRWLLSNDPLTPTERRALAGYLGGL